MNRSSISNSMPFDILRFLVGYSAVQTTLAVTSNPIPHERLQAPSAKRNPRDICSKIVTLDFCVCPSSVQVGWGSVLTNRLVGLSAWGTEVPCFRGLDRLLFISFGHLSWGPSWDPSWDPSCHPSCRHRRRYTMGHRPCFRLQRLRNHRIPIPDQWVGNNWCE